LQLHNRRGFVVIDGVGVCHAILDVGILIELTIGKYR
jgi:hypothetical protein